MKYHLAALLIFSFLLLDKSFYLYSLLLYHTAFKTFFSNPADVMLIDLRCGFLKNPHNTYQKVENKLVRNPNKVIKLSFPVLLQIAAVCTARKVLK